MNRWMPGDIEIANWQFWLLIFLVPATIVAIMRYFSFRLRYEGTELVIRSGIVFRNERLVPYARIQNLDAVRNVVHGLLGVTEVRVETGGGQAPEATISVLHETVFEEMRRRIFEGRTALSEVGVAKTSESAPDVQALESRTLLHLRLPELLRHGVLDNRGMTCLAVRDISAPVPIVSFGPARMPEGHPDTRRDQRRVLRHPACATPGLTVVADSESATRGRSMLKMQPWSGRLRA
jgi:membrane protein YdbS with pleckstrin-like domain